MTHTLRDPAKRSRTCPRPGVPYAAALLATLLVLGVVSMPAAAQRPPPTHPTVDDAFATAEAVVADPTHAQGPLCVYLDNHAPGDADGVLCPLIHDGDDDGVPDPIDQTLCALDPEVGARLCGIEEVEVEPGDVLPLLYGPMVPALA